MYQHGIDVFHFKPGEVSEVRCRVCGAKCAVSRNAFGPTCFPAAIARRTATHDTFECPHGGEAWHEKAVRLAEVLERCASPRVSALMQQDLDELLEGNLPSAAGTGKRGSHAENDPG